MNVGELSIILMCCLFGKMKGLLYFPHVCRLSMLIEKIGELVRIRKQSHFVKAVPSAEWRLLVFIYAENPAVSRPPFSRQLN